MILEINDLEIGNYASMTRRQEAKRNVAYVLLGLLFGVGVIVVGLFGYTPWNDVTAAPGVYRQEIVEPAAQEMPEEEPKYNGLPRL